MNEQDKNLKNALHFLNSTRLKKSFLRQQGSKRKYIGSIYKDTLFSQKFFNRNTCLLVVLNPLNAVVSFEPYHLATGVLLN